MKKRLRGAVLLAAAAALAAGVSGCKGNSFFASMLRGTVKPAAKGTSGGAMEPDVSFPGLDGRSVSLESLKGKVVVVNFWATWCDPCRIEIPWMIGFQQKYANQGFTMLGVAMDDEGKSVVAPFVATTEFDVGGKETTMNYPIVLGNDDLADKFGGLIGLPTTIVIGRDGKIAERFIGLASQDELNKKIQELLQQPS
ncbi:MAG TPA: TlpA disulfide reductase family protein [Verrucomicrobiae bacterium]|nr:TlpA disulfide reductase family protein [Verrucomicrobiae bacterium]